MGGRHTRGPTWRDPMAPSALFGATPVPPRSSEDGYPWALQRWDGRQRLWRFAAVGMVPLRRKPVDLCQHARVLRIRAPARYVWVRHWTPDRSNGTTGWRACLDLAKTIGPVQP